MWGFEISFGAAILILQDNIFVSDTQDLLHCPVSYLPLLSSHDQWNRMYCNINNYSSKPNHVPFEAPVNALFIFRTLPNSEIGFGHIPNRQPSFIKSLFCHTDTLRPSPALWGHMCICVCEVWEVCTVTDGEGLVGTDHRSRMAWAARPTQTAETLWGTELFLTPTGGPKALSQSESRWEGGGTGDRVEIN